MIRIREAYSEEELQPEFKVIDRYFFVTLSNLNYKVSELKQADVGENVGENVGEKSLEEKLIALVRGNPHISQRDMAAAIGNTAKTAERIIKSSERIKRSGPDRGGHWEIVDNKEN